MREIAANESLLRVSALQKVLTALSAGRYPIDSALVASMERLASRAALWASVAAEHGEVA